METIILDRRAQMPELAMKAYRNQVTIEALNQGLVNPATLRFRIVNAETRSEILPGVPNDPMAGKVISSAMEEGDKIEFIVECRRELPNALAGALSPPAILHINIVSETGERLPCGTDAHHIVPVNAGGVNGAQSRAILEDAGIDINDAANGVALPRHANVPVPGRPHQSLHTSQYFTAVRDRLFRATNSIPNYSSLDQPQKEQTVSSEINNIRTILLNGGHP
ncbi:MAG: hypothetical protein HC921_04915 [Synechococcaceae cyanobacterium SM2_3_1]|nr:hypothetical protein [Synechococcaceae cyanobacterium SM2_3_1]